jgi:glyoxylate reductase
VTKRVPRSALEILQARPPVWASPSSTPMSAAELRAAVGGAVAVVTFMHDRVDGAFFDAAGPQLRCVANVAVGFDNVDVAEASQRGVQITNTPGVLTEATADLSMALILAATRRLGEGERLVRARQPWSSDLGFLAGSGLQGKVLGVIGLGAIGGATARRARAFGMAIVYATDVPVKAEVVAELSAQELSLDELAETADVVSVHCPLTAETAHLVDARFLGRMKPTAYLVNAARGPIVDENALVEALRDGSIAGAALDVFEHEPDVHPGLLELDNVFLLPHLGSATVETRTAMAELAARNTVAVLDGEPAITPVNDVG